MHFVSINLYQISHIVDISSTTKMHCSITYLGYSRSYLKIINYAAYISKLDRTIKDRIFIRYIYFQNGVITKLEQSQPTDQKFKSAFCCAKRERG
jgi:hypothetical protein